MAQVRPRHRPSLSDLVDVDEVETAVDALLEMPEREFDDAVLLYLRGDRQGMEAMRHPDVVERLNDALSRIATRYRGQLDRVKARVARGDLPTMSREERFLRGMLRGIDVEHGEIRPLVTHERALRFADERTDAAIERAKRQEARLEHALELRRQLEEVQRSSPRKRAMQRLTEKYPREFLALVREEKEKDAREHARLDGEGAADPPGPTAPSIPTQAARA
jgi:hypothetical protein